MFKTVKRRVIDAKVIKLTKENLEWLAENMDYVEVSTGRCDMGHVHNVYSIYEDMILQEDWFLVIDLSIDHGKTRPDPYKQYPNMFRLGKFYNISELEEQDA
jgi:hypothetical protein